MSHPNPYHPDTSFADAAINNVGGRSTIDATKLDKELSAASESINKTVDNIKMIQRDDGRLKDAAVEIHTLSREVLMLMGKYRLRGFWTPDSDFLVGDVASNDSFLYVCVIAHKSGLSFVEAPNWQRFGFAGSSDAAIAAAQAQGAANSAASSANTATAAANTSITKASESSTAASTATSAAGSASTSLANAATAATQAINANAAAQAAAAASQAAATTSGIANSRIVYGDDASKTSEVAASDLAIASGFYESSTDVPSVGKWWLFNHNLKTSGSVFQRAILESDPSKEFTRTIVGGIKTAWTNFTGTLQAWVSANFSLKTHSHAFSELTSAPNVWHTGNFDPNTKLNKDGGTASELYNTGWWRSIGNVGWYSETYGGGFLMSDPTWIRIHGGKYFKTDWHEFHAGGGIYTNGYGWLHDKFVSRYVNDIGSLCFAVLISGAVGLGGDVSGGSIRPAAVNNLGNSNSTLPGTWRCLGACSGSNQASLFMRVA